MSKSVTCPKCFDVLSYHGFSRHKKLCAKLPDDLSELQKMYDNGVSPRKIGKNLGLSEQFIRKYVDTSKRTCVGGKSDERNENTCKNCYILIFEGGQDIFTKNVDGLCAVCASEAPKDYHALLKVGAIMYQYPTTTGKMP